VKKKQNIPIITNWLSVRVTSRKFCVFFTDRIEGLILLIAGKEPAIKQRSPSADATFDGPCLGTGTHNLTDTEPQNPFSSGLFLKKDSPFLFALVNSN